MKRTKKLLALVLTLAMAFSMMAVTAAAYDGQHAHDGACCEEMVQPRKPAAPVCPYCNTVTTQTKTEVDPDGVHTIFYYTCNGCHQFSTWIKY